MNDDLKIKKWKRVEVFLEFLIFGILVGITEDIIAIKYATGEPITWRIVGIVVLIAIPFAIFGGLLIDKIDFIKIYQNYKEKISK